MACLFTLSMLLLFFFVATLHSQIEGIVVAPYDVNILRDNGSLQGLYSRVIRQRRAQAKLIADSDKNSLEDKKEKEETVQLLSNNLEGTFSHHGENNSSNSSTTDSKEKLLPSNELNFTAWESYDYSELRRSIDLEADPCDNFYNFVCAGFQKENSIKDDRKSVSQFGLLVDQTKKELNELFDNHELMKEIAPYDRLMYHMYDACMNNISRRSDGSRIVLEKLQKMWNAQHELLTDWMINAFPAGSFYVIGILPDLRQPQKQIISIEGTSLFLYSEKLYLEESHHAVMKGYRELLRGILTILGNDSKTATASMNAVDAPPTLPFPLEPDDIERRIDALLDFEMKLAVMINATDKKYDDAYSLLEYTTVAEFQRNVISSVNWERLFNGITPEPVLRNITAANKTVGELELMISNVPLLLKYDQLVRSLSPEQTQFYLDWTLILSLVDNLDDRYNKLLEAFTRLVNGIKMAPPMNETCRKIAREFAYNGVRRMYLRKHYNETAVVPIVSNIKANIDWAFQQMLRNNTWMDDKTRSYSLEKLSLMRHIIGVPKNIDNNIMESDCETLDVDLMLNSNFADARAIFKVWSNRQKLCTLLQPTQAYFDAIVVNAMYIPFMNLVVMPAGILRGVFFDANRTPAINYGAIGLILGHEMIHGFDNTGRHHDASGAVRDWWDKETERRFIDHKRCLIEQYSSVNLTNTTMHVDGELTQGENIADNGGMRAAYLAFEAYLNQTASIEQPRLKGIEQFDARQQFFLGFAHSSCGADRPEWRIISLLTDEHAPHDIRVNVVLSNTQGFADAFRCPAGSPMNPTKKCVLW